MQQSWSQLLPWFVRVTLFLAAALVVCPLGARAQAPGAGIGLSPAVIEENVEPGQSKRYIINVSNLSGNDQLYYVYARDIVDVKSGGVPVYAEADLDKTGYELSDWVVLDVSEVNVPAGGQVPISFTVNVPTSATPGSHFGALFLSVDPPRLRSTGAAVGYQVANIITLRVAGEAVEAAEIRQFSTDRYVYGGTNVNFDLRIENKGNVLLRPTGPLEITNMFGKLVAQFDFNDTAAGVFPKTTREFTFPWQDDGIGFGRYVARVSPVYGDSGRNTITSTVSFWILPMNIIGPALGALFVVLLVVYFGIRLYVRRTVAMMSGGDRRIVRTVRRQGSPIFMITFLSMSVTTILFLLILVLLFA